MTSHPLRQLIETADRAITAEDFDTLMDLYAEDATLVVKPGLYAVGREQLRRAFDDIAAYFNRSLVVRPGKMVVTEGGDTALVIMETHLEMTGSDGAVTSITRQATYVFRRSVDGKWPCVIDNSYGTDLLKDNLIV
jgi:uncharacterized protein (TIGR02246 family)